MAISVSVRPDQEFSPDWNWTVARSKILAGPEPDWSKIGRDLILPDLKKVAVDWNLSDFPKSNFSWGIPLISKYYES